MIFALFALLCSPIGLKEAQALGHCSFSNASINYRELPVASKPQYRQRCSKSGRVTFSEGPFLIDEILETSSEGLSSDYPQVFSVLYFLLFPAPVVFVAFLNLIPSVLFCTLKHHIFLAMCD